MDLNVKEIGKDINIVSVAGELDMYHSNELKTYIDSTEGSRVENYIFDCDDLTYIDSSGVSTLIYAYSTLRKRRVGIWFVNIHGSVERVIELTKLTGFLPIAESVDDVVEDVKKKTGKSNLSPDDKTFGILIDGSHDLFTKIGMVPDEFPSDFKRIRYFTNLIAQRAPAEIREINILEQQISELIKNAVKHGNKCDPTKKVKVWYSFSKHHAHLIIRDEGTGFEEIERWNEFFRKRLECFHNHDFENMENYLTFISKTSDENDGGNAMFAAVEYWNRGVVFTESRNCVAVRRDFNGI